MELSPQITVANSMIGERAANFTVCSFKGLMALRLIGNSRLAVLFVRATMNTAFFLAMLLVAIPLKANAGAGLIMVTSEYCPYCQAWERDVGAVYKISPYAATLPLTRVDIANEMPKSVSLTRPVVGTPTFLIIRNGREIDRQRGYIDAEMFWWWLSEHVAN